MYLQIARFISPRACLRRSQLVALGATFAICSMPTSSADDLAAARNLHAAFHIDLLGEPPPDEIAIPDLPTAMPALSLIGLPVMFGTKYDTEDSRPGLEAGIRADYAAKLGNHLSLTANAHLAKTGHMDDGWGSDRADANAGLRYEDGGWTLAFEPSWRLQMVETSIVSNDYGAALQIAKALPQGFDVSGALRYGRHDPATSADGYTDAAASATLTYRLGDRVKMDLTYAAVYKLPDQGMAGSLSLDDFGYAASSAGPALAMSFGIWETLDLAAAYRYCRSTDDLPRYATNTDRRVEGTHSFDLTASWHSVDPTDGGISLTAAYGYDRVNANAPGIDAATHTAAIAFSVPF